MSNQHIENIFDTIHFRFTTSWTKWFFYFTNLWTSLSDKEHNPGYSEHSYFLYNYLQCSYITQRLFKWLYVSSSEEKNQFNQMVGACSETKYILEHAGFNICEVLQGTLFSPIQARIFENIISLLSTANVLARLSDKHIREIINNIDTFNTIIPKLSQLGRLNLEYLEPILEFHENFSKESRQLWNRVTRKQIDTQYPHLIDCCSQPGCDIESLSPQQHPEPIAPDAHRPSSKKIAKSGFFSFFCRSNRSSVDSDDEYEPGNDVSQAHL
jgi:hypothetical protein